MEILQKIEYLENEKIFLAEKKKHFQIFFRAFLCCSIKIADIIFKHNHDFSPKWAKENEEKTGDYFGSFKKSFFIALFLIKLQA